MQPVTVAIADVDAGRRAGCERLLQGEQGITLLTNVASNVEADNDHTFMNRRHKSRTGISASQDEVARIKRLDPLVVLVNLNLSDDEDYALLLLLRRECPKALVVLLTDDAVQDNKIIQALEFGARGFLKFENIQVHLTKAIKVVGRGEPWLPRKILGGIRDRVLN